MLRVKLSLAETGTDENAKATQKTVTRAAVVLFINPHSCVGMIGVFLTVREFGITLRAGCCPWLGELPLPLANYGRIGTDAMELTGIVWSGTQDRPRFFP
jgi:hypothetical protein